MYYLQVFLYNEQDIKLMSDSYIKHWIKCEQGQLQNEYFILYWNILAFFIQEFRLYLHIYLA